MPYTGWEIFVFSQKTGFVSKGRFAAVHSGLPKKALPG